MKIGKKNLIMMVVASVIIGLIADNFLMGVLIYLSLGMGYVLGWGSLTKRIFNEERKVLKKVGIKKDDIDYILPDDSELDIKAVGKILADNFLKKTKDSLKTKNKNS